MPVQIQQVDDEVDTRPREMGTGPAAPNPGVNFDGVDRSALERLRPIVLHILQEELERLTRQQGY